MSGLVRKDFYVVKSMGRSYLFMFGVFAFLSMMGVYDGVSVLSFLAVMMLIMLPINTFAYDEQSGWEKLAAATPAGRRGVVGAKYLFTVLLLAVGLALCAGIQASMYAFGIHGDGTLGECLEASMITVCAGGILNAILLPLIFRFGTQKSRIFFMIAMGVEVQIEDMAFDALVAAVQTGKVNVAIASMGAKEERKEKVDFTQMYHQQMNVYIAQKDSDISIANMEDIAAYNVGVQSGTLPDQYITGLVDAGKMKDSQVSRYEAPENMILDLEAGRIDLVAGDKNQAKVFEGMYNVKIIYECSFFGTGENIAVPKNQPELLGELDGILDDLREEGFLDELALKWEVD